MPESFPYPAMAVELNPLRVPCPLRPSHQRPFGYLKVSATSSKVMALIHDATMRTAIKAGRS
jgi:hypothetical protein